jgi:hypothetical protein
VDTPKRGADAMVMIEDVDTFVGNFDIDDGGQELDVSCFQDGPLGNFIMSGEVDVSIGWSTWFADENMFDANGLGIRRGAERPLEIFPVRTNANLAWTFAAWKVMKIRHTGQAGRTGLQPVTVQGRARTGFSYPGGAAPVE